MAQGSTRPFAPFEWWIAGRYLRAKRQESFINVISGFSLIGIALGVAVLIVVMSVMNGFRHELLGRILGINGHMMVQGAGAPIADFDPLVRDLRALPGVTRAAPMIEGQVFVSGRDASTGAIARGLTPDDLLGLDLVAKSLSAGAIERFRGADAVILGSRLAMALRLQPGDVIRIMSARGAVTPFGVTPRQKDYVVAGTFDIGMSEYDAGILYMPLDEAQRYFNMGGGVGAIEIMVADPDAVDMWRDRVVQAAQGRAVRVVTWQQTNVSFWNALQVERNVMFLILTLIILVAALNIISGMVMLVKDKSRDIAVLRTMGATPGAVMRVFIISGASIGVVGTLLGLVIGVAFCLNIEAIRQAIAALSGANLFDPEIYFLSQLPARMEWEEVAAVAAMSLTLSFLATLYPSWRAARLDPVEALRYE